LFLSLPFTKPHCGGLVKGPAIGEDNGREVYPGSCGEETLIPGSASEGEDAGK